MLGAWFRVSSFLLVSAWAPVLALVLVWAVASLSPRALWLKPAQALLVQVLLESLSCQNDWAEAAEHLSLQKP